MISHCLICWMIQDSLCLWILFCVNLKIVLCFFLAWDRKGGAEGWWWLPGSLMWHESCRKFCFHLWVLFSLLQDCHSFHMKKDIFSWYLSVLNFQTNLKDVLSKNPVPSQTNYWACCFTFRCYLNFLDQICSKIREIAISCLHWPLNNLVGLRTGIVVPEDSEIFFSIWSQGRQRGCETGKNCWQSASSISDSPHSGETKYIFGESLSPGNSFWETKYIVRV